VFRGRRNRTMRALSWTAAILVTSAACTQVTPSPQPASLEEDSAAASLQPSIPRLRTYLEGLEALGFSGAVLVDHEGEVVLRRGYGMADRATRRPYTPETVQTHGSLTKQVTAAAILLLESRGELDLNVPISRYLGPVPPEKQGVTLHHLLTHSAGFPGSIGRDAEPIGAEEYLERALAAELLFEPGTGYAYSNVGYSLLGIVLERVSGRGYEELVRESLLLPAGLADTGYLLPAWSEERLAEGYLDGGHWGRVFRRQWREDGPGWHLRANGGLHTTVDDMHRWLEVLRGRGPLSPQAVEKWTTPYVDEGGGDYWYAYGWVVVQTDFGRVVTHNGSNGIFGADFAWLPDADLFLYIQGNSSVVEASQLMLSLLGALFDPGFVPPPRVAADAVADPARAAARAGTYAVEGGALTLTTDDVRLLARLEGQPVLDALLGHDAAQRERARQLNQRTREVMARLQDGREDAFAGLVGPEEDAAARSRSMLGVIERSGELESLTLVGSVANVPGSRFADEVPWSTLVRADYPQRVQVWSLLWREDDTYRGTAIGPLSDVPGFTLVPVAEDAYSGIEPSPPWRLARFRFEGDCLVAGDLRSCR
jgi:CubicO group peptidase (beta-lactamase class C family)